MAKTKTDKIVEEVKNTKSTSSKKDSGEFEKKLQTRMQIVYYIFGMVVGALGLLITTGIIKFGNNVSDIKDRTEVTDKKVDTLTKIIRQEAIVRNNSMEEFNRKEKINNDPKVVNENEEVFKKTVVLDTVYNKIIESEEDPFNTVSNDQTLVKKKNNVIKSEKLIAAQVDGNYRFKDNISIQFLLSNNFTVNNKEFNRNTSFTGISKLENGRLCVFVKNLKTDVLDMELLDKNYTPGIEYSDIIPDGYKVYFKIK